MLRKDSPRNPLHGFTLIELLIVVAIIAILAAIAVPNFLEAQVRAKVSRVAADMRSIRTAIESYRVDNNEYMETDTGQENLALKGVGLIRATTPLAYMTTIPKSPFREDLMGFPPGSPKNANKYIIYLWVRAKHDPAISSDSFPQDGKDDNYNLDRRVYLGGTLASNLAVQSGGEWEIKSVGPDNIDSRRSTSDTPPGDGANAKVYDPTNGTTSRGDVVIFSDTSGFATPR
ncbi:MAG: prepilin-type N-terminal cleavage/methylation domain-containing protein [bacterium]